MKVVPFPQRPTAAGAGPDVFTAPTLTWTMSDLAAERLADTLTAVEEFLLAAGDDAVGELTLDLALDLADYLGDQVVALRALLRALPTDTNGDPL